MRCAGEESRGPCIGPRSGASPHGNPFLFGQEDAARYRHLGTILRHCVMVAAAGDRTEEFHG